MRLPAAGMRLLRLAEQVLPLVEATEAEFKGVEAGRIAAEGVGFLAPRATNQTDEGRQKNRRVEAVVTSTR